MLKFCLFVSFFFALTAHGHDTPDDQELVFLSVTKLSEGIKLSENHIMDHLNLVECKWNNLPDDARNEYHETSYPLRNAGFFLGHALTLYDRYFSFPGKADPVVASSSAEEADIYDNLMGALYSLLALHKKIKHVDATVLGKSCHILRQSFLTYCTNLLRSNKLIYFIERNETAIDQSTVRGDLSWLSSTDTTRVADSGIRRRRLSVFENFS